MLILTAQIIFVNNLLCKGKCKLLSPALKDDYMRVIVILDNNQARNDRFVLLGKYGYDVRSLNFNYHADGGTINAAPQNN